MIETSAQIITRMVAKEKGLKFYFTGIPCRNGHITQRRVVNGDCDLCAKAERARNQSQRIERYGKEKMLKQSKLWYHKNSEGKCKRSDGRSKNPNYFKEWWKNNSGKREQYYKQAYTKAARQKWNKENKGLKNFYTRMRQKQIKIATPAWTNIELIKEIYTQAHQLSVQENLLYHVDHTIPLTGIDPVSKQHVVCGLHVPENLQIIPKLKNLRKRNWFLVE